MRSTDKSNMLINISCTNTLKFESWKTLLNVSSDFKYLLLTHEDIVELYDSQQEKILVSFIGHRNG